ncbi:hypothetical protein MAR_021221 [Mya arenaria]|uniref:Uncharacterized protein n=1 Tax=Mya arenaria TaxID=6604 RepID=A0ABY7EA85_MYAAR|nr:hypothetical protein MAR_021221 [Mya arenaria]
MGTLNLAWDLKSNLSTWCCRRALQRLQQYELLLYNAAFVLAYFGMFRISELVFTTILHSDRT